MIGWVVAVSVAAVALYLAGVVVGMNLPRLMREQAYRDGYVAGVQRICFEIRRVGRLQSSSEFGPVYRITMDGLERMEIEVCKPEARGVAVEEKKP